MATVIFTITDAAEDRVNMDVSGDDVVVGALTPAQLLGQSMLSFAQALAERIQEVSSVEH